MHKYSILKKYVFSVIIELQRRDSIEFTKDVHSSYDFIFHRLGEEIVFWNSFWSLWLHLMTTSFLEASLYILTSSCLAKVVKWICLFWVPTLPLALAMKLPSGACWDVNLAIWHRPTLKKEQQRKNWIIVTFSDTAFDEGDSSL